LKNKAILLLFLFCTAFASAQNNTFSPYSRYGIGEMSPRTFAHNQAMGGTHIALRADSTMPIFVNPGNPSSYALVRLTTLEVGGKFSYSHFKSNSAEANRFGTVFSYATLAFPFTKKGGAAFGIMPYSVVGYDTEEQQSSPAGTMRYEYSGSGGLNKAYFGMGFMPFNRANNRFRKRHIYVDDSLKWTSHKKTMRHDFASKLLSEFSIGANANYIFGNLQHTARVLYPNPNLYNQTYREQVFAINNITGNFGLQTAIIIDSVSVDNRRRALKEKVKITFGFIATINNPMSGRFNSVAYNYVPNTSGQEIIRDTIVFNINQRRNITLPAEQGFGIGFKKGERLNVVADFAKTGWTDLAIFDDGSDLTTNYRMSVGANFVPDKYASGRGTFFRKLNYRVGASYETGYIKIGNTTISDYYVSAGIGLPVGIGRLSSMVNVSAQYGRVGTTNNNLLRENYWRIHFGFTFCDRWFQKFRYD
jgi:hypothetical protein